MAETGPNACRPLTPSVLVITHFIGKTREPKGVSHLRGGIASPGGGAWRPGSSLCLVKCGPTEHLGGGSGRGSGAGPRRPTLETQGLDLTWKAQHREYKKDRNRQNQIVVRQMPRKAKKPSFLKSGWQSPLGVGGGGQKEAGTRRGPGDGGWPLGAGNIPMICVVVVGISFIILYSAVHLS